METHQNSSIATVRLYFKFAPQGHIMWQKVSLTECAAEEPRKPVRVAAAWWTESQAGVGGDAMAYWERWLDKAGESGADVAVIPEGFNVCGGAQTMSCIEPLDGPSGQLLQRMAAKWKMFTLGTFYAWGNTPATADLAFNSALLFDRAGKRLGIHNKNVLYDPEEDYGISPGMDGFPVFQTDVGAIGVMTCYESWFPETARLLGYRGAELLLFPSAGFDASLMPARAADSGLWIVASTGHPYAGIWDSAGNEAGKPVSPDKDSGTSILNYTRDNATKMVLADLQLGFKWSPDWNGGDMASSPGGRRARFTGISDIEQQVADAAHHWWTDAADEQAAWTKGAKTPTVVRSPGATLVV